MKIEISEELKNRTTMCRKDFACLENGDHVYCSVEEDAYDKVVFIKCREGRSCIYQMPFGNSNVCNCLIRKEIYRKYKI